MKANDLFVLTERVALSLAAVLGLIAHCRPPAITGLVIAVVIYPFYRKSARPKPHIRKEILEAVPPPFANRYSSCSIMLIRSVGRSVAPFFNSAPDIILNGFRSVMCPTPCVPFVNLDLQAPAAFCMSASYSPSVCNNFFAAITPTYTPSFSVFRKLLNDFEAIKF